MQWEDQVPLSINLGWTDDAEPDTEREKRRWFFTKRGDDDTIRYGDIISIGNGNQPSFVNYATRTVGINLKFEDSPSFEWKILGGKIGDPVLVKVEDVILWNLRSEADDGGEPLIYFDRIAGGNIGWPSSKGWDDYLNELARKAAKEAVKAAGTALMGG